MFWDKNRFKFLDIESSSDQKSNTLSLEQKNKYRKLLNNLLGIQNSDSAIFSKLNTNNLDLTKLITNEEIEKIFTKEDFSIKLSFKKTLKSKTSTINDEYRNQNFDNESIEIIKWKRYVKLINETFEQTNTWPLFIGTYFIKGKLGDKVIYAPLILKEVELVIEDNMIFLKSKDKSCVLNEKIIFLLNEFQGISIPNIKFEEEKIKISELAAELDDYLKSYLTYEESDLYQSFKDLKKVEINNSKCIKTNGFLLMIVNPSGGALRKAVIDLIKNEKINNLINVDLERAFNIDEETVKNIVYKPMKIARICPTDPSQEKAIISSLNGHTIIIGPPGTGKSQTIANILTNILLAGKKALFISQKRVALEVVLERMKSLQFFTLQLVEHKNKSSKNDKEIFYDYLTNFLNNIKSNVNSNSNLEVHTKPLVSYKWLEYWMSKENKINEKDLEIFYKLKKTNAIINQNMFNILDSSFGELQKISRQNEINQLLEMKEKNFKSFVNKLNVQPKFSFLGIKKYDKSINKFFDANVKLLNVMDQYHLNNEMILLLKDFKNSNNVIELEEKIYPIHANEVPKPNIFNSNEEEIKAIISKRTFNIYKQIDALDKTFYRKFQGRVERRFTQPTKFLSLFKNELKQLFNIYVSTPEALSSFIDFKNDKFDYVIFDEASQIFLEKAIPYISISKNVIVAGDDQQMQPTNWFGFRSEVDQSEQEEENIDSLLTYAIESGIPKQVLELNYRSALAALTSFSSKEFYKSNLKTLDNNKINNPKAIEIIDIEGKWVNNTNEIEIRKLIEVLKENINKYKKIILLTLNAPQLELTNIILSNEEPEIYNKIIEGEIILKNLENIQGDEADLVIVSIGYTKESSLALTYVGRPGGRNALNVAITRAKDKMIVIKSIKSSEIVIKNELNKDLTTFKNWIQFLELNDEEKREYSLIDHNDAIKNAESSFEYEVISWLKTLSFNRELKIETQYPIGSYRIDIALIDKLTNKYLLGIEVDGFKYHSTLRQRYNDLVRQNFIESKGYKILRISELLWKTDRVKVFNLLKEKLI